MLPDNAVIFGDAKSNMINSLEAEDFFESYRHLGNPESHRGFAYKLKF